MDNEREEQKHRLYNRGKSDASKLAWKRNHFSYMSGVRKRERKNMKRSFYDICKEFDEAKIEKDNIFKTNLDISLENIAGGINLAINKDNGNVSISTALIPSGSGQYRLTDFNDEELKRLYGELKEELTQICQNFDEEISQMLAKHGLKSTK